MGDYTISQIKANDRRALRQMDALLEKEGIERDKNLDYSIGLFDEDYELAATGSCFSNTLRCLAVSSDHQGEGLLNQVISHLMEYQYNRGNTSLFLYTKCNTAKFFGDLGFHEIARVDGKVVFMENRRNGFSGYLEQLKKETEASGGSPANARIGAVIMNANPFTLGHRYLLEQASAQVDLLHVFVVSEDVSLVPLSVREQLVREGSADLKNLVYHQTGPYMISNATFPSYFLKDSDTVIRSHAKLDIQVFTQIAQALGITDRFVGEEPFSQVTGIYNQVMQEELASAGIGCTVIPRKADADGAISASTVRALVKSGEWDTLRSKVPECTFRYLTSQEAGPVIAAIRESDDVKHY
ncbi:[citrate (pro-3S)-lyase] ligase [Clostridium sp. AN503]|uniref:[citrate (pro-3S)-lyase] ligase n=1 Tax=Clostridium sp. AN503 TaxID=3160598 RepID=UPI00345A3622